MYVANTTTNLDWFVSYLSGRKQYVKDTECTDTVEKDTKCWMPLGAVLDTLLFLLNIKKHPNFSNELVPIMFSR